MAEAAVKALVAKTLSTRGGGGDFFGYLSSQQCLILSGLHFEGKCPMKNTTGARGLSQSCVCLSISLW